MEGLFLIFKFENGRFVLKRIIKCGTAFLLVLVLCLCLLPTTAFAASKQVYIWNFPLSDDTLRTSGKWGHGALNLRFGYHVAANNYTQFRCLDSWQGEVAYCIEPGVPQKNYDSLTDHDDTWWDRMTLPAGHPLTPREVQRLIGRVMLWLWTLRDVAWIGTGLLLSVLALTQTGSMIPLVITAALTFLCIRHGGISMLDFLRYAAAFFFFGQQYYAWRESA